MIKYRKHIGKCRLHYLLDLNKKTLTELSDMVNISVQQLSAYANNKRIMSLPTARLIAQALGCYIDDLYEWKY